MQQYTPPCDRYCSNVYSTFGSEPELVFFLEHNFFYSRKDPSKTRAAVSKALCLKTAERRTSTMYYLKLFHSAFVYRKIILWNGTSGNEWYQLWYWLVNDLKCLGKWGVQLWQNFFRVGYEKEVKELSLFHQGFWWVLQWSELVCRRRRSPNSICLFHQFCLSWLTTLCGEYWSYHKYESYLRDIQWRYCQSSQIQSEMKVILWTSATWKRIYGGIRVIVFLSLPYGNPSLI